MPLTRSDAPVEAEFVERGVAVRRRSRLGKRNSAVFDPRVGVEGAAGLRNAYPEARRKAAALQQSAQNEGANQAACVNGMEVRGGVDDARDSRGFGEIVSAVGVSISRAQGRLCPPETQHPKAGRSEGQQDPRAARQSPLSPGQLPDGAPDAARTSHRSVGPGRARSSDPGAPPRHAGAPRARRRTRREGCRRPPGLTAAC